MTAARGHTRLATGLIANFAGQGISALANFVFIPAYIALLGIESYGLIGVFTVVLTAASLLDAGMTPTLNREMASFHAGQRTATEMRDLLGSVLALCAVAVAAAALLGWLLGPLLARVWLPPTRIALPVIDRALVLMSVTAMLRIVEGMLRGVLMGLHRPVTMNAICSITVLLRAGGVLVPLWIAPSVTTFFLWQAGACAAGLVVLAITAFRAIGPAPGRRRFAGAALHRLRGFAGGVFATSFIALVLSQADKIILVKMTSLETFGYYTVASAVAAVLYQGVLPIAQSYYPHFTIRHNDGDMHALSAGYHSAAQMAAVLVCAGAAFVLAFAPTLLLLWSGKPAMVAGASPVLRVLILGSLFHCLMYVPYMLQLAAGWPRLSVRVNSVAACLYLPVLWLAARDYGAIGAAAAWSASTGATLLVTTWLMHRRLLPGQWRAWLLRDIAAPALAAGAAAFVLALLVPLAPPGIAHLLALSVAAGVILLAAALTTPIVRTWLSTLQQKYQHGTSPT